MSASPIDALLQIAPPAQPARAAEGPSRGDREQSGFGPALEQAYASEQSHKSAVTAEADDDPVEDAPVDASDAFNAAEEYTEYADESSEIASRGEEADDASEADDESTSDEVEISEVASTVVAANEAQAAVIANEAPAAPLATELDAAVGGETGDAPAAEAVPTEGDSGEGSSKAVHKRHDLLAADGGKPATGEGPRAKSTKSAEQAGDAAETSAAAISDKPAAETATIDQPLVEETDAKAEGSSADAERGESRTKKAGNAERVNFPPAEQTAELAATIERHVTLVDQSTQAESGGAEVAAAPPVDAASGGTSTQRAAATLDRLTATSLRRSDDSAQTDGGPPIDRPRFVQRVEGALRAAQQRDGRVQVRLAPPELGVVHIELAVQNGVMTAKLEAETAAARNALLDNLPALRERLAEQNIRVEKFDVDVRRDSQGGGSDNGTRERPGDHGESSSHGRRGRPATTSTTVPTPKTARTASSASTAGLDVRI